MHIFCIIYLEQCLNPHCFGIYNLGVLFDQTSFESIGVAIETFMKFKFPFMIPFLFRTLESENVEIPRNV